MAGAGDAWVYAMLLAGMLGITYLLRSQGGRGPRQGLPEFLRVAPPPSGGESSAVSTGGSEPWPPKPDPLHDVRLALSQAVSQTSQAAQAPAEEVPRYELPYDREEMRRVMAAVVERIDEQQPHLKLHLISVDAARKFGRPRKQFSYAAIVTMYSQGRSLACTVQVVADLEANGTVLVRSLRLQGATGEKDDLKPASSVPQFADFEDVMDTV